jgi:hypothetical protein
MNVIITGDVLIGQTLTGLYTYDNGQWDAVGTTKGFTNPYTDHPSLALSNGIPYVAYID